MVSVRYRREIVVIADVAEILFVTRYQQTHLMLVFHVPQLFGQSGE